MTTVVEQEAPSAEVTDEPDVAPASTAEVEPEVDGGRSTSTIEGRRLVALTATGVVVLVVAVAVALYVVGPLIHDRDQRSLMATERQDIASAAHDNEGLYREAAPTQPPVAGVPVGILTIPALGLQQVVVEGVGPTQTVSGPGHVPGTAGLGQPGNAAVVGRRSAYGGPFGRLAELRPGDRVISATTEGETDYVVRSVRTESLVAAPSSLQSVVTTTTLAHRRLAGSKATGGATRSSGATAAGSTKARGSATITPTALYGPSSGNQLTLVTSASSVPWNTTQAVVVVAQMKGNPFAPTPQESRSPSQQGNSGEPSALAWLLLALLALIAALICAVALYRRTTFRAAYLLTTVPLLALTVLAAEAASHLLPAWS